jgi:IS6 family transposase
MDETYVKVNGRWAYLYRAVDSRAALSIFISPVVTARLHTGFWENHQQRQKWQIPRLSTRIKRLPMVARLLCSTRTGARLFEHRQISTGTT